MGEREIGEKQRERERETRSSRRTLIVPGRKISAAAKATGKAKIKQLLICPLI